MLSLTTIGRITKLHGARGELKAKVEERFLDALYNAEFVFIKQDGKPVPFFLESIRGDDNPILKLEEISTPKEALSLTSQELLLESELIESFLKEDDKTESLSFLTGYSFHDLTSNKKGRIKEVMEYPQQEIANISDDDGKIHLVPLHKELISKIDKQTKLVVFRFPEGLFEL